MSSLLARLWQDSTRVGECYIWHGACDASGYGRITWQGQTWRVHRLAHSTLVAPLLPGECVCHRCDTPPCWRPEHLFAGTRAENMADRYEKGRYNPALFAPRLTHSLSPDQEHTIRQMWQHSPRPLPYELAQTFGVPRAAIYQILGISTSF